MKEKHKKNHYDPTFVTVALPKDRHWDRTIKARSAHFGPQVWKVGEERNETGDDRCELWQFTVQLHKSTRLAWILHTLMHPHLFTTIKTRFWQTVHNNGQPSRKGAGSGKTGFQLGDSFYMFLRIWWFLCYLSSLPFFQYLPISSHVSEHDYAYAGPHAVRAPDHTFWPQFVIFVCLCLFGTTVQLTTSGKIRHTFLRSGPAI